jgi:hypothetical protein
MNLIYIQIKIILLKPLAIHFLIFTTKEVRAYKLINPMIISPFNNFTWTP